MRSMRQAPAPGALVVLVALGLVAAGPAPPAPATSATCTPAARWRRSGCCWRPATPTSWRWPVGSPVLERDRHALAETGLAAGTVRTRVTRLEATQAEAVGLRQRLANQAAIGERLNRRSAVLATARAEVRALVRAERARREAARRALVAARPLLRARALGLGTFADTPAPSKVAAAAVRIALDQVGKPYRWGASGPESFDCSGLVRWAYAHAGLALPRTAREQWWAGRHVEVSGLRPGDLVFWATNPADPATIHHVAVYVGQALMVHAPHTGALVRVDPLRPDGYAGATRPGTGGPSGSG
jgi:peptidoglycan DL-endopeptidase CwlO